MILTLKKVRIIKFSITDAGQEIILSSVKSEAISASKCNQSLTMVYAKDIRSMRRFNLKTIENCKIVKFFLEISSIKIYNDK